MGISFGSFLFAALLVQSVDGALPLENVKELIQSCLKQCSEMRASILVTVKCLLQCMHGPTAQPATTTRKPDDTGSRVKVSEECAIYILLQEPGKVKPIQERCARECSKGTIEARSVCVNVCIKRQLCKDAERQNEPVDPDFSRCIRKCAGPGADLSSLTRACVHDCKRRMGTTTAKTSVTIPNISPTAALTTTGYRTTQADIPSLDRRRSCWTQCTNMPKNSKTSRVECFKECLIVPTIQPAATTGELEDTEVRLKIPEECVVHIMLLEPGKVKGLRERCVRECAEEPMEAKSACFVICLKRELCKDVDMQNTPTDPDFSRCLQKCVGPSVDISSLTSACVHHCRSRLGTTTPKTSATTPIESPTATLTTEGCTDWARCYQGCRSKPAGGERFTCQSNCISGCRPVIKPTETTIHRCQIQCQGLGHGQNLRNCLKDCKKAHPIRTTIATPTTSGLGKTETKAVIETIEGTTTKDEGCPDETPWQKLTRGDLGMKEAFSDLMTILRTIAYYPGRLRCLPRCLFSQRRHCSVKECLEECEKEHARTTTEEVVPVTTTATMPVPRTSVSEGTTSATTSKEEPSTTQEAFTTIKMRETTRTTPSEVTSAARTTPAVSTTRERVECPPTFEYTSCAPKCIATCADPQPNCTRHGCKRKSRCACPANTVLLKDKKNPSCVPLSHCPESMEDSCKPKCSKDTECTPKSRRRIRTQIKELIPNQPACWKCISPHCGFEDSLANSCIYNSITGFCADDCRIISPCAYCFEC